MFGLTKRQFLKKSKKVLQKPVYNHFHLELINQDAKMKLAF